MKKLMVATALLSGVAAAFFLVPGLGAQERSPARQLGEPLLLNGPGSTIGLSVRELRETDAARSRNAELTGVVVETVRADSPASRGATRGISPRGWPNAGLRPSSSQAKKTKVRERLRKVFVTVTFSDR